MKEDKNELKFIGYYFMRSEISNTYPTNEFLKGQIVGRLFGGNTTTTGKDVQIHRAKIYSNNSLHSKII